MRWADVAGFMLGALCFGALLGAVVEVGIWCVKRLGRWLAR